MGNAPLPGPGSESDGGGAAGEPAAVDELDVIGDQLLHLQQQQPAPGYMGMTPLHLPQTPPVHMQHHTHHSTSVSSAPASSSSSRTSHSSASAVPRVNASIVIMPLWMAQRTSITI